MNNEEYIFRIDHANGAGITYTGTGFFVDKFGLFMSAKHNFEFGKISDYRAYYKNEHFLISRDDNYHACPSFSDYIVLRVIFRGEFNSYNMRYRKLPPKSLVGKRAVVIGYDSQDGRLKRKSIYVSDYRNGLFELSDGEVIRGFSGGPVVYNGSVIGIVSSRVSSCKAYASALSETCDINNIPIEKSNIFDEQKTDIYLINNSIRRAYLDLGNPSKAYRFASHVLHATNGKLVEHPSIFASVNIYMGYMLVNSDHDDVGLYQAIDHLNDAIDSLSQLEYSEEVVKNIVKANWLIAIAYRLLGKREQAFMLCEDISNQRLVQQSDYALKLPIIREMAILSNDTKLFENIEKHESDYSHDQVETFFSYRRLLEHYLQKGDIRSAERYLHPTKDAFNRVKKHIFKVYESTFLKNQFELSLAKKNTTLAKSLCQNAVNQMEINELYGQRRALQNIANKYEFNTDDLIDLT